MPPSESSPRAREKPGFVARLRTGAWSSLATRVVVASAACAFVGLVSALVATRTIAAAANRQLVAPVLARAYATAGQSRCEASPASWSEPAGTDGRAFAYDGDSHQSAHPEAPPFDESLLAEIADRPTPSSTLRLGSVFTRGALLIRVAPHGPCALVLASWSGTAFRQRPLLVLACTALASVMAAVLGWVFISRPIARRVRRLELAAARVGEAHETEALRAHLDAARGKVDANPDELDGLGDNLARAHARIVDDANQLREQREALMRHLADVSHDLRTPIGSLQLHLEALADADDPAARRALLASALRDSVYLAALTENLRMASALEAGWQLPNGLAEHDLANVVREVAERARIFAGRSNVSLEVAVPDRSVEARCDPLVAARALANVVENAVSYVGDGGHVAVMLERQGRGFLITVLDDGPPLTTEVVARMGERTYRSDAARARDPRGSGLGLAITREICTRHGWQLTLTAERPRGLRVTIAGALALHEPSPSTS
jgi:signal transduction histidine kinase